MTTFTRISCTAFASIISIASLPGEAFGHAFGRLGVDHYIRVTPRREVVEVEFDVHLGELPTAAIAARLDSNHDGHFDHDEIMVYVRKATPVYLERVSALVRARGLSHQLSFAVPEAGLDKTCVAYIAKGENNEKTLRIRWRFQAPWPDELPAGPIDLTVTSRCRDRWHSSIFTTGTPEPPVRIVRSDVPTDEQKPLPPDTTKQEDDMSKVPIILSANITCMLGPSNTSPAAASTPAITPPAQPDTPASDQELGKSENKIKAMVLSLFQPPLSMSSRILAIALCFLWGAMHAFTPGHGKAVVSAYLVSMRGSYRHALALGLLVTVTHTAVVLVLAVVALILKDRFVYPQWLAPVGATMILLVGLNQIRLGLTRFLRSSHDDDDHGHGHDHDHHHDHDSSEHSHPHTDEHTHWGLFSHSHDRPPGGKDLAIVGISGGMVPCPASIVMLLLAWQLKSPELGLFCLLSFSTGLAATLTLIGVLAVAGTRAVLKWLSSKDDKKRSHRLVIEALMPALGGVVLILCGILLLLGMGNT